MTAKIAARFVGADEAGEFSDLHSRLDRLEDMLERLVETQGPPTPANDSPLVLVPEIEASFRSEIDELSADLERCG